MTQQHHIALTPTKNENKESTGIYIDTARKYSDFYMSLNVSHSEGQLLWILATLISSRSDDFQFYFGEVRARAKQIKGQEITLAL
jgi:hypothetical protein